MSDPLYILNRATAFATCGFGGLFGFERAGDQPETDGEPAMRNRHGRRASAPA
jgi:hypothetical protein